VSDEDEHDLIEAIATADLESMLPRLATYAEKRLNRVGWFSSAKLQNHKMNAQELVDLAIERCVAGKRHWKKQSGYTDLESFLRGVIKSLVSSAVKADKRDQADLDDDGDVDHVDAATDVGLESIRTELVAAIESCASDDEDLVAFYFAVVDGQHTKREDIAAALGWDVSRVSAARIKLQRRLEKQYPDMFGDMKKRRAS
jgi:hypothetical protein